MMSHPLPCGINGYVPPDDYDLLEEPWCECGNIPTEDEEASNRCDACGKPFE
jgi:hypothetical protein